MRVYKNTVIICLAGMLITLLALFAPMLISLFRCSPVKFDDVVESVIVNVFTGFMVSTIITLVGYFHEKRKLIKGAFEFLKSEYQFIDFYSLQVGGLIATCNCSFDYLTNAKEYYSNFNRQCKDSEGFLKHIVDESDKLTDTDYDGFLKKGKLALVLKDVYNFKRKVNHLRQISSKVITHGLEIEIFLSDINIKVMYGQFVDFFTVNNTVNGHSKIIIVQLTRLHEYLGSMAENIEKLLIELSTQSKCDIKPEEISAWISSIRELNKSLVREVKP